MKAWFVPPIVIPVAIVWWSRPTRSFERSTKLVAAVSNAPPRRDDHAHLDIASSAVYRGKVLLELGVGHFGEILLQLSDYLVLGRRIERVAKITKSMRRRNEHEAIELIAAICLVQRRRNLLYEAPFVCPV